MEALSSVSGGDLPLMSIHSYNLAEDERMRIAKQVGLTIHPPRGAALSGRIQKKEVVRRIAQRMGADEKMAEAWLDAFTDTLYEALKEGRSVTLPGLGGFYVRTERETWVFKFNPAQKLRALFGWSSTYKGKL